MCPLLRLLLARSLAFGWLSLLLLGCFLPAFSFSEGFFNLPGISCSLSCLLGQLIRPAAPWRQPFFFPFQLFPSKLQDPPGLQACPFPGQLAAPSAFWSGWLYHFQKASTCCSSLPNPPCLPWGGKAWKSFVKTLPFVKVSPSLLSRPGGWLCWPAVLFTFCQGALFHKKNTHYFGLKGCRQQQQQQHVTNRRRTQKNMFPQQNKKVVTTKKTFGGPPNHNQHTNQQQLFPKKLCHGDRSLGNHLLSRGALFKKVTMPKSFCQGGLLPRKSFVKTSCNFCQESLSSRPLATFAKKVFCQDLLQLLIFCQGHTLLSRPHPFVKGLQQRFSLISLHCSLPRPFFSASKWIVSMILW